MGVQCDCWAIRPLNENKNKMLCSRTFYVFSNEGIFHDVSSVRFQYFLKFSNIIILIRTATYEDMYLFSDINVLAVSKLA